MEITMMAILCSFWFLFLGRTVMLMQRGIKVFVLGSGEGKKLHERLLEMLTMPALIIWSLQITFTVFGYTILPAPMLWDIHFLRIIGLCFCVCGLLILIAALVSFGNSWRIGVDEKNSNTLVTTGIFAFSRNPIFLFMDLFFAGVFLVFPNWFFLVLFILMTAGVHLQILKEEEFLRSKFGVEYNSYCEKVRRYF